MSVSDQTEAIHHGLESLYKDADLVIITGGLGPTEDDVTKKSLAAYLGDNLVFSQETYDRLARMFERYGRSPLEAHRQQCMLPSSAQLITNKRGTAPGMWMQKGDRYLLSMPGVPSEMKGLMLGGGLQRIADLNPDTLIDYQIIKTVGIGESVISERIQPILTTLPDHIEMGMIGTAESCTGGHISQLITSISGSSKYYKGSVIAYANEVKTDILGVPTSTLEKHGAVSEPTVRQMVLGLIDHLDVDIAVAVSGIAGPTGGSPEKPVGTIWMAVGNKSEVVTRKLSLSKNRELNIRYTAVFALDMMRRFLLKQST